MSHLMNAANNHLSDFPQKTQHNKFAQPLRIHSIFEQWTKKSSVGKKCQNRYPLVTWSSDFATLQDWPFKGGRASEIVGSRVSAICNWNRGRIYGNELLFSIGIFSEWKNLCVNVFINERLAFECDRFSSCCAFSVSVSFAVILKKRKLWV